MFEVNGTQYELKMNTNRVKMVEAVTGKSIMGEWKQTDGLLSLQTVESCFQLCTKEVGSDYFLNQTIGLKIGAQFMEEHGYAMAAQEIMEALQGDMPFLFQAN